MSIKNMQGTSAFLEYLRPKEESRRSKKRCEFYDNGICKCSKYSNYMCKCSSPTYCVFYNEIT